MKKLLLLCTVSITSIMAMEQENNIVEDLKKNSESVQLSLVWASESLSSGENLANDPVRNQFIITGDEQFNQLDYGLQIVDYKGNNKATLMGHSNFATCFTKLPNDPDHLVSSGLDGNIIVWNLKTNTADKTINSGTGNLCLLALNNDLVAVGGGSGYPTPSNTLFIWSLSTGNSFPCTSNTQLPCVQLMVLSQDNLFASNSWDGYLSGETRVWDYKGNPKSESLPGGGALALYTCTDSLGQQLKFLVTGNASINFMDCSANFKIVSTKNDQQQWVKVIKFTTDNNCMVSGGFDGRAIIYAVSYVSSSDNPIKVEQVATCNGHASPICDLKILEKNKFIMSLSNGKLPNEDATLRIWDFQGNQLAILPADYRKQQVFNLPTVIRELNEEQTLFAIGANWNAYIVQMQVSDKKDEKEEVKTNQNNPTASTEDKGTIKWSGYCNVQ